MTLADRVDPDDYERRGPAYFHMLGGGGPYCLRCMEEGRKARTLTQPNQYRTTGECATCKSQYGNVFQAKLPVSFSAQQRRNRPKGLEEL